MCGVYKKKMPIKKQYITDSYISRILKEVARSTYQITNYLELASYTSHYVRVDACV